MAAIVFAIPVFLALIGLEFALGRSRGHAAYRLNDAVGSLSAGMLSQVVGVFTAGLWLAIYMLAYRTFAVAYWRDDDWRIWLIAFLGYDFCYYWLHRAGHEIAIFWAAHVVHHQSEDYNLTTALRQTSSGAALGWIFYLPLAVIGVPPVVFIAVGLVDLLYQFWIHTGEIGKLGWFDRVFASPSNHRVHHAVNARYLDRNYGGVLMIWDRLFGTFEPEGEACVYGVRSPLGSFNPLWANVAVYVALARASWRTFYWRDKARVWLAPPGWLPADLAAADGKAPFDLAAIRRYDPKASGAANSAAFVGLALCIAATAAFLWLSPGLSGPAAATFAVAFAAALWAIGATLEGRIAPLEAAFVLVAAVACCAYALDARALFVVAKPAATLMALVSAALRPGPAADRRLLVVGLGFSLIGDTVLLWPSLFAPGLGAFLVAQGCYVALFWRGVGVLPSRLAVAGAALYSAAMFTYIWPGLDAPLVAPVVAYVVVISLMVAQAIGRATRLRDAASLAVAVGAAFFVLSDSLIAVTKFVAPNAWLDAAILPTYYLAQALISFYALPRPARALTP